MSTSRTATLPPAKRNPEGGYLCRWCQKPVPKPRLYWCSDECVEDYEIRANPAHARMRVFERDKGVCARCGADTERGAEEVRRLWRIAENEWPWRRKNEAKYEAAVAQLAALGFTFREYGGLPHFWEAHHTTAVVEGGGECGLEGYETLCLRCHKAETALLAARRAKTKPRRPQTPEATMPRLFDSGI